jgi:histidine ammonia-lyase
MKKVIINNDWVSLVELESILASEAKLEIGEEAIDGIQKCRAYLDKKVETAEELIYGVNTGFGSLCDTAISKEDLSTLQSNLVKSHACGMGDRVPNHIVKRILLLKILGLSKGHSGVQVETVNRLIYFYNNDLYPVIFEQGSLGASGDLSPLAHMSLPLLGEGEMDVNGVVKSSSEVLKEHGLSPIVLQSKEGLALLNGTQFMSAYATYSVSRGFQLWHQFHIVAGMSLDGFDGRVNPFQANVHQVRHQKGQMQTAALMEQVLKGSEIAIQYKKHVQDPYSFRCIPQVHGATKDTLDHAANIVEREVNAVTDNPTVFPDEDDVVSAGNFHGQPLALIMDFLAIAIAELGSISERRIYKLVGGTRGLPAFLVTNPGLNSGFMIPQYTAASIVSQNKQLCTPASVDSIDSSNGQEDHVSMGANAATKLYRVVENVFKIQGIELMNAAQALEFRRPLKSSDMIEACFAAYRKFVPYVENDDYWSPLMHTSMEFVKTKMIEDGNGLF